jgi:glycerophosphoryl diester phosphodiesterase
LTLVIAHRGASGHAPENTLAAYELAVEQRADMIEIDLHRTLDGAIVVTHDEELSGLGGRGEIADATLAEVRSLDAGGGERVPVLSEVLDRFGARIPFNLELKRGTRQIYPELERETLALVERRGLLERMLFSSFFDPVLEALRAQSDGARIGVLVSPRAPRRWVVRARSVRAEAVHFHASLASERAVETAHAEGLAVHVYTVDRSEKMRRLIERGVDGIFTNHPDRLRALLD